MVVTAGIDTSTEQIVDYVRGYRVPLNVLFFEYLRDGDREYLARSWLSDPELEASSGAGGKKQTPWNGQSSSLAAKKSSMLAMSSSMLSRSAASS